MLNWFKPTRSPRHLPGAISTMYRGTTTETPPMASPPMKRNHPSACGPAAPVGVNAQPRAETRKRTAIAQRVGRRPNLSLGFPARNTPKSVPISATDTTSPCQNALSPNSAWIAFSAPDITPESNPKRKPPTEAATETYRRNLFMPAFYHTARAHVKDDMSTFCRVGKAAKARGGTQQRTWRSQACWSHRNALW